MPWSNHGDILQPTFYRVIIDMSNATNYPTAGTTGGGVTPNPSEVKSGSNYYYNNSGTPNYTAPSTDAAGLLRERGNMRWEKVVLALGKYAQCDIMNINIIEANGDAQATSLGFTVRYERDAFNREEDVATPGSYLTGANCIKQLVATGITTTHTILRSNVWQPVTSSDTPGQQMSVTATSPNATYSTILGTITVETVATAGSGIEETAQYVL
jgi:hypothetical protein